MKIGVISDLHIASHSSLVECGHFDVLIIAGDLVNVFEDIYSNHVQAAIDFFKEHSSEIIFVPGNHEYYSRYGITISEIKTRLKEWADENNIILLDNSVTEIYGRRFIGSTLWTNLDDFRITSFDSLNILQKSMNDFRYVRKSPNCDFTLYDWFTEFSNCYEFLENGVQKGDIIITHHLADPNSISRGYEDSPLNLGFASSRSYDEIFEKEPMLWIHGHTHTKCDYFKKSTRVICNPCTFTIKTIEMI